MLSTEEFKKALGSKSKNLTDEEMERRRDIQNKFADVIFDIWLKKRNQAKITSPPLPLKLTENSSIIKR